MRPSKILIHPMCVVWHWQCCGNMWLWPWHGVCGFSLGLGFGDHGGLGLNLCLGSFGLVNVTAVKVYFSLVCAANKPLGFLPTVFAGNVLQSAVSVYPFVFTRYFEQTDLLTSIFCMRMVHDRTARRKIQVKVRGQGEMSLEFVANCRSRTADHFSSGAAKTRRYWSLTRFLHFTAGCTTGCRTGCKV